MSAVSISHYIFHDTKRLLCFWYNSLCDAITSHDNVKRVLYIDQGMYKECSHRFATQHSEAMHTAAPNFYPVGQ